MGWWSSPHFSHLTDTGHSLDLCLFPREQKHNPALLAYSILLSRVSFSKALHSLKLCPFCWWKWQCFFSPISLFDEILLPRLVALDLSTRLSVSALAPEVIAWCGLQQQHFCFSLFDGMHAKTLGWFYRFACSRTIAVNSKTRIGIMVTFHVFYNTFFPFILNKVNWADSRL